MRLVEDVVRQGPARGELRADVDPLVAAAALRGAHAADAATLLPLLLAGLRPGDAVLVKGSLGSRMGPIAEPAAENRCP